MYSIGIFSKLYKVTPKTLHHYDELGLLHPEYVDSATGYRYYTLKQGAALRRILELKRMGFSLPEILEISNFAPGSKELLLAFRKKKQEIQANIAEEKERIRAIEQFLLYGTGEIMQQYQATIKCLPEVIVASMRRVIPDYNALFDLMPNVMGQEMMRLHCECAIPAYCFNLYHDGEYRENNIDVEMCEAVVEAKEDSEILTFKTIPAVKESVCIPHHGSYDSIGAAYAFAVEWVNQNGYEICGNPRESFIDGIWNKETEDEWLTELQIPVKKTS